MAINEVIDTGYAVVPLKMISARRLTYIIDDLDSYNCYIIRSLHTHLHIRVLDTSSWEPSKDPPKISFLKLDLCQSWASPTIGLSLVDSH